jgi:hypothetical protein
MMTISFFVIVLLRWRDVISVSALDVVYSGHRSSYGTFSDESVSNFVKNQTTRCMSGGPVAQLEDA